MPPSSDGRRRRVVSPDEARVWRAVVRDVKPLPGHPPPDPAITAPPPPLIVTTPSAMPRPSSPPPPRRSAAPPPPLEHGRAAGLDKRTAERMQGGDMEIDGRLDLHGMTQDSAHAALNGFVLRAYDAGRRCLLVITGKGRLGSGVLRAEVPRWLNQSPLRERVLGFSYAKARHGGEGALYVLVKRRR